MWKNPWTRATFAAGQDFPWFPFLTVRCPSFNPTEQIVCRKSTKWILRRASILYEPIRTKRKNELQSRECPNLIIFQSHWARSPRTELRLIVKSVCAGPRQREVYGVKNACTVEKQILPCSYRSTSRVLLGVVRSSALLGYPRTTQSCIPVHTIHSQFGSNWIKSCLLTGCWGAWED